MAEEAGDPDSTQAGALVDGSPASARRGTALCLSGGGYRAMVFHLGVLWRLNEVGFLARIDHFSSVSGGSITAAMLGLRWASLGFENCVAARFETEVVAPIRKLASTTIDRGAILGGIFLPGTVADRVRNAYRKRLYGDATLQDLPDRPLFVINASNVQSGVRWRFSKPCLGDYRVGLVKQPGLDLATAVSASSAFPPVLSPARLRFAHSDFAPGTGKDLQRPPFTTEVFLTDGGVYDNLGLESAWKRCETVLISDAGGRMAEDPRPSSDWARHGIRVSAIVDNQVRSLRKRQAVGSFATGEMKGAYWGIRTDITHYKLEDCLECAFDLTTELAEIATRLAALPDRQQERLINWGYAACDAGLRRYVTSVPLPPPKFPYPRGVAP